jgi:cytochrome P450
MKPVPTVRGRFGLGVLPSLIRDPVKTCAEATRARGDVVRLSHVQRVLQTDAKHFGKGKAWEAMRGLVGHSLVTADGPYWLRQRRIVQPAFHRQRLASLVDRMLDEIQSRIAGWDRVERVDVAREMRHLTLGLFLTTMFGQRLVDDEAHELDTALPALVSGLGTAMWTSFLPSFLPAPGRRGFRRSVAVIDRIVYRLIADRRAAIGPKDDLLQMLLDARDEETGEHMNDQQLRDEVVGLFIAAFEATSLTLSWATYALTQHPAEAAELRATVERVLGERRPGFEDLAALGYARRFFEESMRKYPPGWVLPRQALDDVELCGYAIPKNAFVLVCNYLTHQHADFWERPESFEPERFLPERAAKRPRYAFVPFGGGAHLCVGNHFALMEAQLALVLIVQRYRLELAAPVKAKASHVMLRPDPGLFVRFTRA